MLLEDGASTTRGHRARDSQLIRTLIGHLQHQPTQLTCDTGAAETRQAGPHCEIFKSRDQAAAPRESEKAGPPEGLSRDERMIGALLRHINAIQRGEVYDPESGLPHAAHAMSASETGDPTLA